MCDFSLVPIVFRHFVTCIVPCDVDLRVLIFLPKASGGDGGELHETHAYITQSLIWNKSVTTQNLALLCYWYRKKCLQMHF